MESPISLTMAPSGKNLRLVNVHGGKRLMRRLAEDNDGSFVGLTEL